MEEMSSPHKPENSTSCQHSSDETSKLDTTYKPEKANAGGTNSKSKIQFDNHSVVALAEKQVLSQKTLVLEIINLLKCRNSFIDVIIPYLENEVQMFNIQSEMLRCHEKQLEDREIEFIEKSVFKKLRNHQERYMNQLVRIKNLFEKRGQSVLSKTKDFYNEISEMFQDPTMTYKEYANRILIYAKSLYAYADLFQIHEVFCSSRAKSSTIYSNMFSNFGRKFQSYDTKITSHAEQFLNHGEKFRNDSIDLKCHGEKFRNDSIDLKCHAEKFRNDSVDLKCHAEKFRNDSIDLKCPAEMFRNDSIDLKCHAEKFRNDSMELKCHANFFTLHKENSNLHKTVLKIFSHTLRTMVKHLMNSERK